MVSVDAAANTLVVHGKADQTFTVTSTTKITGVDGLASLTAGTKVSGSYSKSADGATLTVYTLKVTEISFSCFSNHKKATGDEPVAFLLERSLNEELLILTRLKPSNSPGVWLVAVPLGVR